jgi:hypothetical protein
MSTQIIDLIETTSAGVVLVRYLVCEQGKDDEYIRSSFEPGQDVSDQPQEIQDACTSAWTPEVLAAWEQRLNQFSTPPES